MDTYIQEFGGIKVSYLNSNNVEVFPVAKARVNNAYGRLFTEKKIANLTRQLLSEDYPGYIISCKNKGNGNFDISFNLYGYYFNLTEFVPSSHSGTSDTIYAYILIENDEIKGQDEPISQGSITYQYEGLVISSTEPSTTIARPNEILKYIKLFEKSGNSWVCPANNFGLVSSLAIGGIDGKHV
jgi:hypothetical protein